MKYDCIDGSNYGYDDEPKWFTLGDLISLCKSFPKHKFFFAGTLCSPGQLQSWRGSYDIPSVSFVEEEEGKTGKQIAKELEVSLKKIHHGYKGGEYKYHEENEFYISQYGRCEEFKIFHYETTNNEVILYTKLDPY